MLVSSNPYGQNTNFGAIMDTSVKKVLTKRMKFGDLRQYVQLKHEQQKNPYNVILGQTKENGHFFGEIWEPNSSFIKYVEFEENPKSLLGFIKGICTKANPENMNKF